MPTATQDRLGLRLYLWTEERVIREREETFSRIVTSFVPSENVASTCTVSIISGTPPSPSALAHAESGAPFPAFAPAEDFCPGRLRWDLALLIGSRGEASMACLRSHGDRTVRAHPGSWEGQCRDVPGRDDAEGNNPRAQLTSSPTAADLPASVPVGYLAR